MAMAITLRDQSIQIVHAKTSGSKIKKIHRVVTEPFDLIDPQSKHIKDLDEFEERFQFLLRGYQIKEKEVSIVLDNAMVLTHTMTIPKVDKKKQKMIVQNEMMSYFNIGLDYICDYQVIRTSHDRNNKTEFIVASAISKEAIDQISTVCHHLKLKIKTITTALATSLHFIESMDLITSGSPQLFVDYQEDYTRIFLTEKGELKFLRTLRYRGKSEHDKVYMIIKSLEHMNQYLKEKGLGPVTVVRLVGSPKKIEVVKRILESEYQIRCEAVLLNEVLGVTDLKINNCFSTIGVML